MKKKFKIISCLCTFKDAWQGIRQAVKLQSIVIVEYLFKTVLLIISWDIAVTICTSYNKVVLNTSRQLKALF
jgi:hypothetical protein